MSKEYIHSFTWFFIEEAGKMIKHVKKEYKEHVIAGQGE